MNIVALITLNNNKLVRGPRIYVLAEYTMYACIYIYIYIYIYPPRYNPDMTSPSRLLRGGDLLRSPATASPHARVIYVLALS